jgi:hypothetical protein
MPSEGGIDLNFGNLRHDRDEYANENVLQAMDEYDVDIMAGGHDGAFQDGWLGTDTQYPINSYRHARNEYYDATMSRGWREISKTLPPGWSSSLDPYARGGTMGSEWYDPLLDDLKEDRKNPQAGRGDAIRQALVDGSGIREDNWAAWHRAHYPFPWRPPRRGMDTSEKLTAAAVVGLALYLPIRSWTQSPREDELQSTQTRKADAVESTAQSVAASKAYHQDATSVTYSEKEIV